MTSRLMKYGITLDRCAWMFPGDADRVTGSS